MQIFFVNAWDMFQAIDRIVTGADPLQRVPASGMQAPVLHVTPADALHSGAR